MADIILGYDHLKIPDSEKRNIVDLQDLLKKAASELNYEIETHVVGGVIKKQWPRKDIDLLCKIQNMEEKFFYETTAGKVKASFNILEEITTKAMQNSSTFKIERLTRPYQDQEYDNPEILAHNGSILIRPMTGVPIEIVNNSS